MKALAIAVAVAGVALLAPADGQTQAPQSTTAQHQAIQNQITTHDGNQTTEHNALSQNIDGLSQAWDKVLPPDPILPSVVPCPLGTSSRWKCIMGGGAVLDKETGLVWEQSPDTTSQNWFISRSRCINKNVGGRKGWRLPSIPELASLVDPANSNPPLPTGHPFSNVQSNAYWSASTDAVDPTAAWLVGFINGVVGAGGKTGTFHVWCVRGAMNADQY